MGFFEIFMIGLGLSMDAAAVSMSNGMCMRGNKGEEKADFNWKMAFFSSLMFGIFQGIMPLIGYLAGSVFAEQIAKIDHWIALILLGYIGGKMLYDAWKKEETTECKLITPKLVFVQAIATSIDALAVGVSFAAMTVQIWTAVSVIAVTTFILSFCSVRIGKRFGDLLNHKAEILGGLILIGIGLKIFIEHMLG